MPSKTDIIVNGLDLTVYGLEEYNNLPKGTPVGILFAIHGRLQQKAIMEPLAGVVCPLNDTRSDPGQRHLLVVTFDQVNHGSRLVDKNANNGWEAHNPSHAVDMWSMIHTGANTVSELIDVLEHYLFGGQRPVQVWGCMGFSMGGHVAFLAGAQDARISVVIPVVGTSDLIGLLEARLKDGGHPDEYMPEWFKQLVHSHCQNMGERLKSKKLLSISGGADKLVPGRFNEPLVELLRTSSAGREYQDWAQITVDKVGHAWCPEMGMLTKDWCHQWMVNGSPNSSYVLTLPDTCNL